MIVLKLQGGMGNQMFQYATGRAMALQHRTNLGFDMTSFGRCSVGRRYSLGLWKVQGFLNVAPIGREIVERGLPYNPELIWQVTTSCTLNGYWQTEKYFAPLRDTLLKEFVSSQPHTSRFEETKKMIERAGDRSVFLTVRRTDYLGNAFHGELPASYYQDALSTLQNLVGPNLVVFVFSDDPTWCFDNMREWLPGYDWMVAGNFDRTTRDHLGREDEELQLMASCQHAVMANSSYSWWGAWMGPDRKGGKVICPRQWFGPASTEDPRDICPDRWIKI